MKKFLFVLLILFPLVMNAQEDHIKFRDIPVDGHIDKFVASLSKMGYFKTQSLDNCIVLSGEFANKKCEVFVLFTHKTNTVWKVAVFLPVIESWSSLKYSYQEFREQYRLKYGSPSDSYEFFKKPYYDGDGYEMLAVKNDKCNFISFWDLSGGSISVKIGTSKQIVLGYEDRFNSELEAKEKNNTIQNDI